ncbi:MAG: PspC domain-containing protein, partial [Gordonia sp. (in: high G+C Gram-positive bacteria)]
APPSANEVSDGVDTTPYTVGDTQTAHPHTPTDDDQLDPLLAHPTPPSWDPLGVADFAWDLPNPTPTPVLEKPKPPRSAVLPVTAGLAVLTAMAGTAAQLIGAEWFTVGRIASLTLLVIGAGLVVAGFQRKPEGGHASGLVPLGVLVGAIAVVATMIASTGWSAPKGGIGERKYEITEQSQLREHYELSVGNTILDLRGLGSLDADKTITVNQGVGEIEVLLPPNVRVRPDCSVGIGDFTCPTGVVGGSGDGPVLTIDAHVGMGNVEMKK